MSNIEQNLELIQTARYGKDVRQAIHDSIHDCYEDGKAGATDLVAREQIANLVANVPEGSTKDSELVDIRTGFNGESYTSAGEAVRNGFKKSLTVSDKAVITDSNYLDILETDDLAKAPMNKTYFLAGVSSLKGLPYSPYSGVFLTLAFNESAYPAGVVQLAFSKNGTSGSLFYYRMSTGSNENYTFSDWQKVVSKSDELSYYFNFSNKKVTLRDEKLEIPTGFVVSNDRFFSLSEQTVDLSIYGTTDTAVLYADTNEFPVAVKAVEWTASAALDEGCYIIGALSKYDQENPYNEITKLWIPALNDYELAVYSSLETGIAFIGDSITAGVGAASGTLYHMMIQKRYNIPCKNYGVGASGISRKGSNGLSGYGVEGVGSESDGDPKNALDILNTVPSTIKKFVIASGTNEYGSSQTIENFEEALQTLIDALYDRDADFLFITPIRRKDGENPNTIGKKLSDYVTSMKKICKENGVICIDIYDNSGLNPDNDANNSKYYSDGLHIKTEGHKQVFNAIAEAIYFNLINRYDVLRG